MKALLTLLFLLASCAHNWSPTVPPGTTAKDEFTGQVVSCSMQVENAPVSSITHCVEGEDAESVDSCMVGVGKVRGLRDVICTSQDLAQTFHVAETKGDAWAGARAAALDAWFRRHGIFVTGD